MGNCYNNCMIRYKTPEEIVILRQGGRILGGILKKLGQEAKAGVSSAYLEDLACKMITDAGGEPAFKNYDMGDGLRFPSALCVSINSEVVHGPALPSRIFKAGDIVSLDIGMKWKYLYTDTAITVPVGKVSAEAKKLMKITREALYAGIKQARVDNTLNDIGKAIYDHASKKHGYGIVEDLVGHGVGYQAHEDPNVPNYEIGDDAPDNLVLEEGLVIAIEPMVNMGTWRVKILSNKYTFATKDDALSARFEHSVAITKDGPIILTEI